MYSLLSEIDQIQKDEKVLIVATTNQLDKLDKALRRGGRLDLDIRLDMPTDKDRFEVLKEHLRHLPHEIEE